ncbi:MAG: DUF4416 family protein [FCB group bacterium]|nr:DUF4416 family protein [FCB group bacterium]
MEINKPLPVKCFSGIIFNATCDIAAFLTDVEKVFGRIDAQSEIFAFDMTDYYEKEMGRDLKRMFIAFEKLIFPGQLPEIKLTTNLLEKGRIREDGRTCNLDPGYLDLDKVILASAKYAGQKIYLDQGIYADPVLSFHRKAFHPYSWSFPDFSQGRYDEFFLNVRQIYKTQLKQCSY